MSPSPRAVPEARVPAGPRLPAWASELISLYESNAYTQFILYGNVHDRMLLPLGEKAEIRSLEDFVLRVLLPDFDVILAYDLGNGIRVEKGEALFSEWPFARDRKDLARAPRAAVEVLTHYFRYCANLRRVQGRTVQVACLVSGASLVAPAVQGGVHYDLSALAMLLRDWSSEELLWEIPFATFLVAENRNDLHPLLQNNPRAAHVEVPLPSEPELSHALRVFAERYPTALAEYREDPGRAAGSLTGATLASVEGLLKTKEYAREPIHSRDLVALKKRLVERDANDLIEFVKPDRTLDDYHGQQPVVDWLRKDLELWRQDDLAALPMGYLLCGPVGTGKTFLVECLAGEADVPVVKLKNFRDKWVGSTEGNLERIFRLLHALGRCFVFVDEADQALGRRVASTGDSGVSGRVYSMLADEMSDTRNRGRILWVLASSRPDLIEVDLKRPGRIDVRIPLFPTTDPKACFALIRALCAKRGLEVPESAPVGLEAKLPASITPGSAEALAVKIYRTVRTEGVGAEEALRRCVTGWRSPVPASVMDFQIGLAVAEASDPSFVPPAFAVGGGA
jgi:hypothetical protein